MNPTKTWTTIGSKNVGLTVTDDDGATSVATHTIVISSPAAGNQDPVAVITGPALGTTGIAIEFKGEDSYDTDGTIEYYTWQFGATYYTTVNVNHTFSETGIHMAVLAVTDDDGAVGTTLHLITLEQGAVIDPTGTFTINDAVATETSSHKLGSKTVDFGFTATQDAASITAVEIDVYKDGTLVAEPDLVKQGDGITWEVTYIFPSDGTFEVHGTVVWASDSKRLMSIAAIAPSRSMLRSNKVLGMDRSLYRMILSMTLILGIYDDRRGRSE